MLLMKNQDSLFLANSIYNILKIIVIIEWWKAKGHRPGLGRRPKKYQEDHSHLSPETDPHPSWMTGRYSLAESCMTAAKQTPFLWWKPWHEVEFLRHKTMIKLNWKFKPIMWPCWHVVKKKKKEYRITHSDSPCTTSFSMLSLMVVIFLINVVHLPSYFILYISTPSPWNTAIKKQSKDYKSSHKMKKTKIHCYSYTVWY